MENISFLAWLYMCDVHIRREMYTNKSLIESSTGKDTRYSNYSYTQGKDINWPKLA